jgi:hypothetical protein
MVEARGAARHAELQRIEHQHAVLHDEVGGQNSDRQARGLDDAASSESDVSIDRLPAVSAELLDRQRLVGRLRYGVAAPGLAGVRVGTDEWCEVGKLQQARHQRARQQRAGFARDVHQRAVQVAAADASGEVLIHQRL